MDRHAEKWFKPALGQFQIYYQSGIEQLEYQPDFVAETADSIYLLESKANRDMEDPDVLTKKDAAMIWCKHATEHTRTYGGKPWRYSLISHEAIADNMTLEGLVALFS